MAVASPASSLEPILVAQSLSGLPALCRMQLLASLPQIQEEDDL